MLESENAYFASHQIELAEKYDGKFVVIAENEVIGVFDNSLEMYQTLQKNFSGKKLLIRRCSRALFLKLQLNWGK